MMQEGLIHNLWISNGGTIKIRESANLAPIFVSHKNDVILKYWFLGGAPTSIYHFFRPSVRRAPYLRNRTLSDHNFWYTYVKWWYVQAFFHFLKILIFLVNGQKMTQNEKKNWFLVNCCKMMISPGVFFFGFLKFWFSRSLGG